MHHGASGWVIEGHTLCAQFPLTQAELSLKEGHESQRQVEKTHSALIPSPFSLLWLLLLFLFFVRLLFQTFQHKNQSLFLVLPRRASPRTGHPRRAAGLSCSSAWRRSAGRSCCRPGRSGYGPWKVVWMGNLFQCRCVVVGNKLANVCWLSGFFEAYLSLANLRT